MGSPCDFAGRPSLRIKVRRSYRSGCQTRARPDDAFTPGSRANQLSGCKREQTPTAHGFERLRRLRHGHQLRSDAASRIVKMHHDSVTALRCTRSPVTISFSRDSRVRQPVHAWRAVAKTPAWPLLLCRASLRKSCAIASNDPDGVYGTNRECEGRQAAAARRSRGHRSRSASEMRRNNVSKASSDKRMGTESAILLPPPQAIWEVTPRPTSAMKLRDPEIKRLCRQSTAHRRQPLARSQSAS